MNKIKVYGIGIAFPLLVGALSAFFTRNGMTELFSSVQKPPLSPPGWLFPVVWSILFILMGIGSSKVYLCSASRERSRALKLYLFQLAVNFFWSIIFFNLEAFLFAFIWLLFLLVLIVSMTVAFKKCNKTAAFLQMPYILWVCFAGYLNFGIWLLSR